MIENVGKRSKKRMRKEWTNVKEASENGERYRERERDGKQKKVRNTIFLMMVLEGKNESREDWANIDGHWKKYYQLPGYNFADDYNLKF